MVLDRRQLVAAAGLAGALAACAPKPKTPAPAAQAKAPAAGRFPDGFGWGVATAAYQVEGAWNADGKGPSIWDTYAHTPGKIANGDTGDVAVDHYHRYREDVALMASIGAKAYRFSISWPRIFPQGTGQPNPKGLDFYSRLVDELLKTGIAPFATLYHWDLPQALQDKGGWQSRDTAQAFADYAGHMAGALSDRVGHWFTLNELHTFVDIGHKGVESPVGGGSVRLHIAPGLNLAPQALNQVRHHAILAHGLAVQAIRAKAKKPVEVGPAENVEVPVPMVANPESLRALEAATRALNGGIMTAILEGKYPDSYLHEVGADAPKFTDADMKAIGAPVDFVGMNVYRPAGYLIPSDQPPGWRMAPFSASHPRMRSVWHVVGPEVMYWAPQLAQRLWKPKAIYITENGCAGEDAPGADGRIYDTDRVMFTRNCLFHLQRAIAEGAPVKGYFHWSLMDNFEWTAGYGNRSGLIHVDFKTLARTPKESAAWFRQTAAQNAVA